MKKIWAWLMHQEPTRRIYSILTTVTILIAIGGDVYHRWERNQAGAEIEDALSKCLEAGERQCWVTPNLMVLLETREERIRMVSPVEGITT